MAQHVLRIVSTILFFLSGCTSNIADAQPGKLVSDFYQKNISISDRMKQFRNYSLEDKYELYIFGNKVIHPPATYLAEPFAQQGAEIIPFLRKKLEVENEEARIRDIALVFSEAARLKIYDFSKDAALMNLLNQKIGNMQGIWKDAASQSLSEIQSAR